MRKYDDNSILKDLDNGMKIKEILTKYSIRSYKTITDIKKRVGKESNGRHTVEYYLEKMNRIHSFKYEYPNIHKEYITSQSKVTINCSVCKTSFKQSISHHIWSKSGCSLCYGNSPNTIEKIINRSKKIHGDVYSFPNIQNESISSYDKITIYCNKCNHTFRQAVASHTIHKNGCNKCNKSKSEKLIHNFLISNNINFISQKKFEGCKYKNYLFFDFYIPSKNLCIEFDGEQHFRPWRDKDGENRLRIQKIRDEIKNNFCKINGINLRRISYRENVEFELSKIFIKK